MADACHRHGVELGFYYSLPDWHFAKGLIRNEPDTTTNCTQFVNADNVLSFVGGVVTVVEFEGDINVVNQAVALSGNRYVLTEQDGIIHSAFDAYGYLTTQSRSFMTWSHADLVAGEYNVIIEYVPQAAANEYRFTFGDKHVDHILPGVDAMLQTCIVGRISLKSTQSKFTLDLVSRKTPLEPLGLEVKRILITRIN